MAARRPRFFLFSAIAIAVVVFFGFFRTFYLRSFFPELESLIPPEPLFVVHGLIFTAWILILCLQAWLVYSGRIAWHRTLGLLGALIAVAAIITGIYGAIVAAARPEGFMGVPLSSDQFLIIPMAAIAMFAIYFALALLNREDPQRHKRWMLLATVNMLEPAFIRFPFDFMIAYAPLTTFGPALLFVVALGIYDRRTLGKVHRITFWGGIAIAVSLPLAFAVSGTSAWLGFANWLIGLV